MLLFCNPSSITGEKWKTIPITKYAAGMNRGLYYTTNIHPELCGTFYYYEPESKTYLAYNTSRTFVNKTDALDQLTGIMTIFKINIDAQNVELYPDLYERIHIFIRKHING